MMYIFFAIVMVLLAFAVLLIYIRTSKIMKSIDEMLDRAIDHNFAETNFTEDRLSKLEAKMYRYLSADKTIQSKILAERNSVEALVSDISHQTKIPISNIMLYTELLKENEHLDNRTHEMLLCIGEQTDKLNFLIQALVKISRLENGIVSVIPKTTTVKKLIEHIGSAEADKKGVRLVITDIPDITAEFDVKWTSEAIANLIDNAIKYTPPGGSVTVSAAEYEMFVRIDIADTGIGIPEGETAKIFTRFYRSPAVSAEKGVGIGLYLARQILMQENGYIKVSSEIGKGSVFSVFLPKKSNLSKL